MKFIAHLTKGLEQISEDEIRTKLVAEIIATHQKAILFECNGEISHLNALRTIDDIGVYIGEFSTNKLLSLDLGEEILKIKDAVTLLKSFREINETYSITLSKYKSPRIDDEIFMNNLILYLNRHLNFAYTPTDHTNLDLRITVSEDKCLLTVKLFPESLYRRDYGHVNRLGSIRATIAGAMLYKLVGADKKLKVVDILCGSGTFLCEALSMGFSVSGNDHDNEAVQTTLENLNKVKRGKYDIRNFDVSKTGLPQNHFDIAVSNFPWEKQIKVEKIDELIENTISEYARILKPDSKIGLISTKPEVVKEYLQKYSEITDLEEYKIGYLGQVPTIILAEVIIF